MDAEPVADEAPTKPKRVRRKKAVSADAIEGEAAPDAATTPETLAVGDAEAPAKPKRTRRKKAEAPAEAESAAVEATPAADAASTGDAEVAEADPAAKPKRTRRKKADPVASEAAPVQTVTAEASPEAEPATDAAPTEDEAESAPRRGWWQRTFGA